MAKAFGNIRIFCSPAHQELSERMAERLGIALEKAKITKFLNQETSYVAEFAMSSCLGFPVLASTGLKNASPPTIA